MKIYKLLKEKIRKYISKRVAGDLMLEFLVILCISFVLIKMVVPVIIKHMPHIQKLSKTLENGVDLQELDQFGTNIVK